MTMKLKINGVEYSLEAHDTLPHPCHAGNIYFKSKRIELAKTIYNKQRTQDEVRQTMWHEIVHGIFYEVGRKRLACDEKLVDDVAKAIIEVHKQLVQHGQA